MPEKIYDTFFLLAIIHIEKMRIAVKVDCLTFRLYIIYLLKYLGDYYIFNYCKIGVKNCFSNSIISAN